MRRGFNKYGARKTVVDGLKFDSKREAARWLELRTLERGGVITGLERQVRFDLTVNGVKVGRYTADFVYSEKGAQVVEDVKGMKTRDYVLRKKLMLALFGVSIRET